MKLAHYGLSRLIISEDCMFTELIIESSKLFAVYIQEMMAQQNGDNGGFVLSDRDKIIDFSKNVEIIFNPFAVDINDKKILSRLYFQLAENAVSGDMFLRTQNIRQMLYEYLLELEQTTSHVLSVNHDFDFSLLFKSAGIKHDSYEENFVENLSRYIKLVGEVLNTKLIIFVNLRSYVDDLQVAELLKDAEYAGMYILFLENQERSCVNGTFRYIIDNDECEIY